MIYSRIKQVNRLRLWVILLASLNISIICAIGINMLTAEKKKAASEKTVQGVNDFFVYYLKLNSNQVQQFDSIITDYSFRLKDVGIILRNVKERLNMDGIQKDSAAMHNILSDFLKAQELNRDLTVRFYGNIRDICSPEQIARLNEIIEKTTISKEACQNAQSPDKDE